MPRQQQVALQGADAVKYHEFSPFLRGQDAAVPFALLEMKVFTSCMDTYRP